MFSTAQRDRDDRVLASLKAERAPHDKVHKELRDFFAPRTGEFPGESRRGERTDFEIINEAAIYALRISSSGMADGVTPRSRPWLEYSHPDPELAAFGPVKEWLSICNKVAHAIMINSNIYGSFYHMWNRMLCYGPGCFGVYEDDKYIINTRTYDIGTYYWTADYRRSVNGFWQEFQLTVEQLVSEFRYKNCSVQVQNAYDKSDYTALYPVVHLIEENRNRDITRIDNKNKRWRSCYYLPDDKTKNLRDTGFDYFPIIGGRWEVFKNGPYASSPGMDCLGSVKMLQLMEEAHADVIEKGADPTMIFPASMADKPIDDAPGGKIFADEMAGMQPARQLYNVQLDTTSIRLSIEDTVNRIQEIMFSKQFMPVSIDSRNQRPTATEINKLTDEQLASIGRVLEGADNDVLNPVAGIIFKRMIELELVPPPPRELQGEALKVEYRTRLHQASKAVAIDPIMRVMDIGAQLSSVEMPKKIDEDQIIDEFAEAVGVPPKIIRTDEVVEQMNAAEAQQIQQAQQMQMAQQAAETGKTMADTPVGEEESALDMLLGR